MAHACLPRWLAVGTFIALFVKIHRVEVVFVPSKGRLSDFSTFGGSWCSRRPRDVRVWRRSSETDYWRVLGVEPGTSVKEVKRVYRQRAKKEHPDVNKSSDALQRWRRLSDAYGKLIDPNYRKEWEAQQVRSRQRSSNTGSTGSRSSRYGQRDTEDYNDYTSRTTSTSTRSGAAFQEEARKWAGTGWEYFRDLLQRTDIFQGSSQNSQSYVVREWKAAELELAKLKQELQKARADEAKYLELTEQFKRRGQKTEELQAGRRTWDALSILFYADLLSIGDIQPSVDYPTDSIFPEPRAEETELPVAATPDTEERSSLKNTLGDFQIEKAEAKDLPGDHRTPTPPEESAQAEGQKIPPEKEMLELFSTIASTAERGYKDWNYDQPELTYTRHNDVT
eukprot:s699_g5.t1